VKSSKGPKPYLDASKRGAFKKKKPIKKRALKKYFENNIENPSFLEKLMGHFLEQKRKFVNILDLKGLASGSISRLLAKPHTA
jgi:hypothetical protein